MPLPSRSGRLRLPVLCFIVGPADVKGGDLDATVAAAVAGGVTMVQLRAHELPAGELLDIARRLKTLTRGKAQLVVSDRIDVAIAAESDGVQIPEAGVPTLVARGLIGKYAVVGRSVHSVESAVRAGREGAEFVLAGTIFKSPTHPGATPAGIALITEIVKATSSPVVAVGGINAENIGDAIKAGASGVAVISAIAAAEDPKAATEALALALKEAWAAQNEVLAAATA
jgi:thiamine-phosphate pyrophosphorylase